MEASGSSIVCSADVAAFVDALETINYNEAECYDPSENVVICISEQENLESASVTVGEEKDSEELSVTDIEDSVAAAESGSHYFNPDTRKLKAVMQRLVAQKKAIVVKKTLSGSKGSKQFKSDVWNWFGDVRLFISESDAERLKIPYYIKYNEQESSEAIMICKVFVGCFRCNALFMYDAQKHSTSTLRYHVRACNRPKECIYVSEDKMDDEPQETSSPEKTPQPTADGSAPRTKRFRTDPRKQKEVIEQLFQKQRAVVTRKSFMNMKGNRRFKSDVWNWFGDIKLLISRSEAKQLKIPYYIRRCGDEQMVLSKVFVGCFKCMALFIHDSQKSTSTLRYHIRTCSRPKERKKRTTPNIIFFPNKRSPKQPGAFTDTDAIQAHEKLLNFALSTESSLDVIQDPEFHKMLQLCITVGAIYGDVNVDSLLCATPTLTSFILNDLYVSSVNAFYTEFQHAYGATYKPMVWIDEQMKSPFLSVHCSYADPEGQLKTVVLHTDDFDYDSKTPVQLKEWFALFLGDQPVIPFKRILCIDNESSMEPAFKDEMVVKCVVQNLSTALQLVATKGTTTNGELPDFTALLGNCIDIVDYFDSISEHCQVPQDLVKCADDKWTSILALFASVDAQYDAILNVLNDTGATHLLSAEKATVSGVVEFLRLFEEAVVLLSSTTEPTLNLVIPWVTKLQKKLSTDRGDSVALKQLKSNIIVEFNERVVKNLSTLHQMATLLDPRFKKLSFGSPSDHREACTKVKSLVKECMEEKGPPEGYEASKCQKAAEEEVDKYLASSFSIDQGSKFSVLAFWQDHLEVYPNLCRIAQWLLTCPASSNMGCETFSSNYWVVHCPRLPIEHDNVNKVLFVKSFKGL